MPSDNNRVLVQQAFDGYMVVLKYLCSCDVNISQTRAVLAVSRDKLSTFCTISRCLLRMPGHPAMKLKTK